MTTFQAIVYAIVHGISQFLPVSSSAHYYLIPDLVDWQPPVDALNSALALGAFIALFIYFRHDWASMISSLLQIIIFRRKPMTLDERLPLFVGITTLPYFIVSSYFKDKILEQQWSVLTVAAIYAAVGIPLWIFDHMSRKIKGTYDWTWLSALWVGTILATAIVPGWDPLSALFFAAMTLNFRREAAVKYCYFCLMPILTSRAFTSFRDINFQSSSPALDLSWLSFGSSLVIAILVGLLSIGGFMKHVQRKGLGQYLVYRWLLAGSVLAVHWLRSR